MGSHHRLRMIVSRICTLFGALCAGGLAVAGEPGTTAWSIDASAAKRSASAHLAVYDTLPAGSVSRLTAVSGPKQDTSGNGHLPAHRSPPVIELPNGEHFTPAWSSRIEHADGNVSFVAVDAAGAGLLQMTMGPDASFARISSPSGNYRFESFGAEARLVDVGHAGIMLSSIDDGASGDRLPAAAKRSALAKAGETAIDVLFLYSDGFAARYPGSAAVTRIHYFQAIANQALANSAVSAVVRVAGTMQSAYPDSEGSNGLALDRMRQALAGQTPHPAFANLPAQRQGAGADVVVLLRPHDIETRGSCGIARFPNGSPAEAVHVVSDGFSSWSLCDDDVFTHELGHNLGAEHQFGASSPNPGFGTAHVRLGRLHTVMGSFGTGNPNRRFGLQRFSNPGRPCGGAPCGAAGSSDNARRISENLALVSGYANAAASTPAEQAPPATDPDPDGDGAPESLDAFPFDARYQSDRDNDGVADNIDAFPDQAGEWLDSDGDGTAERSADAGDRGEVEVVEDLEDVDGEVLESVGAGVVGRGAAAVAAQVEGDGAGGRGDAVGDGLVQPAAEAVGVQQHDRWPVAAPVECPDGDAGLAGEVDHLGGR